MYLCFLDESGSPPKPNKIGKRPYFVIAALVMHEAQWHGIASEFANLIRRRDFKITGEIKWRYFGPHNDDPDNSVAHLSEAKRDELRKKLFEIITARRSVKVMACITSAAAAYELTYVKNADDLYIYTYKTLTERFQYYLQDLSRVVGDKQLGIVVADHRGKTQDDLLRKQHTGLVTEKGIFTSNYENYVETVFLTPSHYSVGIQLVDMVAGAIGRQYNVGDDQYAAQIRSAFRTSAAGNVDGFGIIKFPKRNWR
jgi:hypothetical protein